jgi:putative ABC transport system permease protein
MTFGGLVESYAERVRAHPMQELLAGLGVAIGVALVFAVFVANSSITSNAGELVRGIAGSAQLELSARSPDGFSQQLVQRVRALSDVAVASPLLEQRAVVVGPDGRSSVNLFGVDRSITELSGSATRNLDPVLLVALADGVMLPKAIADVVGVPTNGPDRSIVLTLRGRAERVHVGGVLDAPQVGPVADAAVAIAQLARVQALAGLPGRISRVLVTPEPGRAPAVAHELRQLAGGRITVAPVEREVQLIARAAAPSYQATGLFAAIAAVCGALLVLIAMLLTAPERRRSIAFLRTSAGYTRPDIVQTLAFEAIVLGSFGSIVGLTAGFLLATTLFAGAPSFLSFAFALSGDVTIDPWTAVLVGLGGIAVTCLAACPPLLDLRTSRPVDAVEHEQGEAGQRLPASARAALATSAVVVLVATIVFVLATPSATIVGIGAVAIATALAIPMLCVGAARLAEWIGERTSWHTLSLAAEGLRARTVRASALAAMGAVAICGCLAIEGAHRDVLRGLDANFKEFLASGAIWITAGGAENSLTTESFPAADAAGRVRDVRGVERVRPYYGGLLDVGDRRVWILGRGAGDAVPIPPSQLLEGDLSTATEQLRSGRGVAVSNVLATQQGTEVGGRFTLPTPSGPQTYRVAAIVTNLGWGPGAVIMAADRYRRDWLDPDPSALEVDLLPSADPISTRRSIDAAIGPGDLHAQTIAERYAQFRTLARDGLDRLTIIAWMLVGAAALSLAAGTIAAIWQRRRSLSLLRAVAGHRPAELWRILLLEATIALGTGCAAGFFAGLLGHKLLARWLALTTGYPAPFALDIPQALALAGIVLVAALVLIAAFSTAPARTDPRVALEDSGRWWGASLAAQGSPSSSRGTPRRRDR